MVAKVALLASTFIAVRSLVPVEFGVFWAYPLWARSQTSSGIVAIAACSRVSSPQEQLAEPTAFAKWDEPGSCSSPLG